MCGGELVLLPRPPVPRRPRASARAEIGDEIGDGDVGLVPDGRDHRDRAGGNRPRHDLLVERPEILERTAAAPDDHHVDVDRCARPAGAPARSPPAGAFALHARRRDDQVRVRIAPAQDADDVAQRRAVDRGDDADAAGEGRQRALARLGKQPFGRRASSSVARRRAAMRRARRAPCGRRRVDTRPSARRR